MERADATSGSSPSAVLEKSQNVECNSLTPPDVSNVMYSHGLTPLEAFIVRSDSWFIARHAHNGACSSVK